MRRLSFGTMFVFELLLISAKFAKADFYSFTTIDVPGASSTVISGINDSGQILGYYFDSHGAIHSFLDTAGSITALATPGTDGQATGINDSGQVVGTYIDSNLHGQGFVESGGSFTTFVDPPATPSAINNNGQIVGVLFGPNGAEGFLDTGGHFATIDVPGSTATFAQGINANGEVVGYFLNASGPVHGFVDSNGTFSTFDYPGVFNGTALLGINDLGQIVGDYTSNSGFGAGFLDSGGILSTISDPFAQFGTIPVGINNSGQIVGFFFDDQGTHGFLATCPTPSTGCTSPPPLVNSAVPEPGVLPVMAGCFVGLAAVSLRKRMAARRAMSC